MRLVKRMFVVSVYDETESKLYTKKIAAEKELHAALNWLVREDCGYAKYIHTEHIMPIVNPNLETLNEATHGVYLFSVMEI